MTEASLKPAVADPWGRRLRDALPPGVVCALAGLIAVVVPALLLYFGMMFVIAAVVGVVGMALVITQPYLGLLIFLGLLYLRPEESFPALAGARMSLLVSMVALCAWAINSLLCRERSLMGLPAVRCLFGFVGVALGSTVLSGSDALSVVAMDMLKLLVLFVLIVHLIHTEGRLRTTAGAILLFSVILGARTIWQYQHGEALVTSDGDVRALATGIFGDPNDLALAMAMALPIALGFALGAGRWGSRLFGFTGAIVLIWTIFITNSRGGVLALGVCLLLFFRRRMGRFGIVLGALAVLALFAFGPSRMNQMTSDEESAQGRVVAWQAGLDMLRGSPLWGVGKDQFTEHHGRTAHNSLMLCLAELGILGTVCWVGIFYFAFRDTQQAAAGAGAVVTPPASSPSPLSSTSPGAGEGKDTLPEDPPPPRRVPRQRTNRCLSGLLHTSLVTFLVGGFFLSRTYTPPLYVYLSLAVAAGQVDAARSGLALPGARFKDGAWIVAITLAAVPMFMFLVRLWGG